MLHFRKTIISVLALFFGITSVSANPAEKMKMIGQYVVVSLDTNDVQSIYLEPDEIGTAVFSEKLDDLVSSWYINNIFLAKDVDTDFTLYRHISVSDSVLIGRLKKVEAAVKLSYNNIVRDWIEMYATRRPAQVEIMLGLSAYYFPFSRKSSTGMNCPTNSSTWPSLNRHSTRGRYPGLEPRDYGSSCWGRPRD